jgi:tRNA threonylcarbamoyladenosine biosynthesis protein TsaE
MNTAMTFQIKSDSLAETEKLGSQIGLRLRGGEVIVLTSDLGGGKTAFVRGLVKGMGSQDHVASPTFTISREYSSSKKNLKMYHFDFYRLQEVVGDPHAVIAIEWGDIVAGVLPEDKVTISIEQTGENTRNFTCTCPDVLHYLFV